jgi:hypothetical protein
LSRETRLARGPLRLPNSGDSTATQSRAALTHPNRSLSTRGDPPAPFPPPQGEAMSYSFGVRAASKAEAKEQLAAKFD